jgi:chorismate mutase
MDEAGQRLRIDIDNIDEAIIDVIAERFDIVAELHLWKLQSGLPLRDVKRETEVKAKYVEAFGERDGTAIFEAIRGPVEELGPE